MAMTVRLKDTLRDEAKGYADRLGVTVNALIAVALREYLDAHRSVVPDLRPPVPAAKLTPSPSPQGGGKRRRR